jgi:hypothetical protein
VIDRRAFGAAFGSRRRKSAPASRTLKSSQFGRERAVEREVEKVRFLHNLAARYR